MMTYATYDQWKQVSPDYDMERNRRILTITEQTTVREILDWRRQTRHNDDGFDVVIVVEPQEDGGTT